MKPINKTYWYGINTKEDRPMDVSEMFFGSDIYSSYVFRIAEHQKRKFHKIRDQLMSVTDIVKAEMVEYK